MENIEEKLTKELNTSDLKAREKVIVECLELVSNMIGKMAYKYSQNSKVGYEDYKQEGLMAAFEALKDYDSTKNASFKTWCFYKARDKMQTLKAASDSAFNSKATNIKLYYRAKKLKSEGLEEREIADKLKISLTRLKSFKNLGNFSVSTSKVIGDDITVMDTIKDDSLSPEEKYIKRSRTSRIEKILGEILTEREQTFLFYYFGINERPKMTITELAKMEGLTKQRGQQIVQEALRKLRNSSCKTELKEMLFTTIES